MNQSAFSQDAVGNYSRLLDQPIPMTKKKYPKQMFYQPEEELPRRPSRQKSQDTGTFKHENDGEESP